MKPIDICLRTNGRFSPNRVENAFKLLTHYSFYPYHINVDKIRNCFDKHYICWQDYKVKLILRKTCTEYKSLYASIMIALIEDYINIEDLLEMLIIIDEHKQGYIHEHRRLKLGWDSNNNTINPHDSIYYKLYMIRPFKFDGILLPDNLKKIMNFENMGRDGTLTKRAIK